MLRGRIAAALAIGNGGHGGYADFVQAIDRLPLLTGAQYWQFGGHQVFGHFTPADTPVNLDEIATTLDFGTQRAPTFELAINLTVQTLDFGERIAPIPEAFERLSKDQFHPWCSARITSAACCGML